jgi:polyphosphate kinase
MYTDYGLFTCDPDIGDDVHELFLQLTSLTKAPKLKKILSSPFMLHSAMMEKIEREMAYAENGKPARIMVKINALIEPDIISALYKASCAGVQIDLIVRGICCLRPGIPGLSENIRVRSLVGRFLEHSRIHYFRNGGSEEIFISSADWMDRNFFRRVEVCCPITDKKHRKRIVNDLKQHLADNSNAWLLNADGSYTRMETGDKPVVAQSAFLERMAEAISS